mmetsp:Transcript_48628/g.121749  ORF Transcript_48628/g.121749 Transcript_48628/m.121749 type:complete len:238 (-) Transcript_48628:563-1276(-)
MPFTPLHPPNNTPSDLAYPSRQNGGTPACNGLAAHGAILQLCGAILTHTEVVARPQHQAPLPFLAYQARGGLNPSLLILFLHLLAQFGLAHLARLVLGSGEEGLELRQFCGGDGGQSVSQLHGEAHHLLLGSQALKRLSQLVDVMASELLNVGLERPTALMQTGYLLSERFLSSSRGPFVSLQLALVAVRHAKSLLQLGRLLTEVTVVVDRTRDVPVLLLTGRKGRRTQPSHTPHLA